MYKASVVNIITDLAIVDLEWVKVVIAQNMIFRGAIECCLGLILKVSYWGGEGSGGNIHQPSSMSLSSNDVINITKKYAKIIALVLIFFHISIYYF